ncbi:MAG: leucine-rich repeat protein [Bacteroidaceae bacterium]|nr:leucine-rich repeat protein [Bacteroidaceae bacterium]
MMIRFSKCILLLTVSLCSVVTTWGRQRTDTEVLDLARAEWQQRQAAKSKSLSPQAMGQVQVIPSSALLKKGTVQAGREAFYVCSLEEKSGSDGQGYVLISADDRMPAVLGYADEGAFDPNDMPEGLADLMNDYAEALARIEAGAVTAQKLFNMQVSASTKASVLNPLLGSIKYNQGSPYNLLCPQRSTGTARCATGCVATAMAQLMRYYKYPTGFGTGSVSYTSTKETPNTDIAYSFDTIQFDWANMTETYNSSSTDVQRNAVATLMAACGASVKMQYGSSSSASTSSIPTSASTYFGYDPDGCYVGRKFFSTKTWHETIQEELLASRPVIIRGTGDGGGGHAFIIDGFYYTNAGLAYYHVNWGWGGSSNGNFLLTLLKPSEAGTGGSATNYSHDNGIVTKLTPDDGIASPSFGIANITGDKEWALAGQTLSITIDTLQKVGGAPYAGTMYLYIVDENGNEREITSVVTTSAWKSNTYYKQYVKSYTIPTTLPAGMYTFTVHPRRTVTPNFSVYNGSEYQLEVMDEDPANSMNGLLRYNFKEDLQAEVRAYSVVTSKTAERYVGDIVIPDSVTWQGQRYAVTGIHDSAFYGCTALTSIVLNEGIREVHPNAFKGCTGLKSVTFSKSLQKIGNYAFQDCTLLTKVEMPDSVSTLGGYAFAGCTALETIVWPEMLTAVGVQAFSGCTGLKELSFPKSMTKIQNMAFANCTGLLTLTIPANVTDINTRAFQGCSSLQKINMEGNTPSSIGAKVFDATNDCPIYVPEGTAAQYKEAKNWTAYADRIVGVTGIKEIRMMGRSASSVIRDMQGRVVAPSQLRRGEIYIIDSRKVLWP